MNVTIRTTSVELPNELRDPVFALVEEALCVLGAPPDTDVRVTFQGPRPHGARRHRVEVTVNAPRGTLRATGVGADAGQAVAVLRETLLRQAEGCRAWHEGGAAAIVGGAWMRGRRLSARAMREAPRLGAPSWRTKANAGAVDGLAVCSPWDHLPRAPRWLALIAVSGLYLHR